jgi:hypothetical protein
MRDLAPVVAGVAALFIILTLLGKAFDTSARTPAHALELAGIRAEADAAKAERDRLAADLARVRDELKRATEELATLRARPAAPAPLAK